MDASTAQAIIQHFETLAQEEQAKLILAALEQRAKNHPIYGTYAPYSSSPNTHARFEEVMFRTSFPGRLRQCLAEDGYPNPEKGAEVLAGIAKTHGIQKAIERAEARECTRTVKLFERLESLVPVNQAPKTKAEDDF